MEESDVIELSKTRRQRKPKEIPTESKPEPVVTPVESKPEPVVTPVVSKEQPTEKPKRQRKKKVEETTAEPPVVSIPTPVVSIPTPPVVEEKPKEETKQVIESVKPKQKTIDDIDTETLKLVYNFLDSQGVISKPQEESTAKPKAKKARPKSAPASTEPTERQDLEARIDLVKQQIQDKRLKRTAKENAFLKQKLTELEEELAGLDEDDYEYKKPTTSRVKPVKLTEQQVEQVTKPKMLPRHQVMSSFGF